MKSTKDKIVDLGENLIKSKGYNAFSFKDISGPLEIKNAAVHYHFPSKEDLGKSIVKGATEDLLSFSEKVKDLNEKEQFIQFTQTFIKNNKKKSVCIMGALSPDYSTLPKGLQASIKEFSETTLTWLSRLLEKGRENGTLNFFGEPQIKAKMLITNLMSSLLLAKVLGQEVFDEIYNQILKEI